MDLACEVGAHVKAGWIPGKLQKLESQQCALCESCLILSDTYKGFKNWSGMKITINAFWQ